MGCATPDVGAWLADGVGLGVAVGVGLVLEAADGVAVDVLAGAGPAVRGPRLMETRTPAVTAAAAIVRSPMVLPRRCLRSARVGMSADTRSA